MRAMSCQAIHPWVQGIDSACCHTCIVTSVQISLTASLSNVLGLCSIGLSVCQPDTTHNSDHKSNSNAFLLLATGERLTARSLGHAVPIPVVKA